MNVLLEQLGAQAVYLQEQPILSMYSYHETTGVVVDVGERIDIVPVDQGSRFFDFRRRTVLFSILL